MWTGRQTLASIEGAHYQAAWRGRPARASPAFRGRGRRAPAQGAARSAARAGAHQTRRDGGRPARQQSRRRRTPRRAECSRTTACASLPPRAARGAAGRGRERRGRARYGAATVEPALGCVEKSARRRTRTCKLADLASSQGARDDAEAVAAEAEKKAADSEAELSAKRKPYDGDPLFTYLWHRRFGHRRYAPANFARAMDRIVGRLRRLRRCPAQLRGPDRDSAASARARDGKAHGRRGAAAALSDIEQRAMFENGVDAKEKALAEARHKLAAVGLSRRSAA